ncbi:MAG TPA: WD40 repeat domain-containing protein [Gammaproteobacteria bacterium]|nr:WD40 repeat domain-containing protein [Gammaproteobacteria bacterium]
MKTLKFLFIVTFACVWLSAHNAHAGEHGADIYSIHYSADGRYLITGGAAGNSLHYDNSFTGGVKIWDAATGHLVKALGQQVHLRDIFGNRYGRVGKRDWGIRSFKDVVLNGSYPNGKVIVLPSSLGRVGKSASDKLPGLVGAYLGFSKTKAAPKPIHLGTAASHPGNCGHNGYAYNYIGPVVPSRNGRFAAVVTNICQPVHAQDDSHKILGYRYDSTLDVMNLSTLKVIKSYKSIDHGVYAVGISNNGRRVAYVGSEKFAVVDVPTGKRHIVETYNNPLFQIPRQFSELYFNRDGSKLVSLRYVYDIAKGKETELPWKNKKLQDAHPSSVKVAPDMRYFVLTIPNRSAIVFGDDGLPHAYGKADRVVLLNSHTGAETDLKVTDDMHSGKKCVTAISPDSAHVAVACMGGLIKVFNARTGQPVWQKHNVGYRSKDAPKGVIQARNGALGHALMVAERMSP